MWSACVQTAAQVQVTICDPNNSMVAYAQGTGAAINVIGAGTFNSVTTGSGGTQYSVYITANGNPVTAYWTLCSISDSAGNVYANTYTITCEDSSDMDFNDVFVSITYFTNAG